MNYEQLECLARQRRDMLTSEAAVQRALCSGRRKRRNLRRGIAVAFRAIGYAALTLGDALSETS